mgnify:CR=1 FL=1
MKIIIDADACPVVDIAVSIAKERNLECILVCDNTHFIQKDGAETVIVDKGADSADCKIANLTENGDVVITQDYGVAALALVIMVALGYVGANEVFKTDNVDLFNFSLEEINNSEVWHIDVHTYDLHEDPMLNFGNVMTEYEEKFSSKGNPICKLIASR